MKIKSIMVGGFKNLAKSKIEFEGIAALLAINNYGKSNLLEAIDFGMDFINAQPRERKNMMGYTKAIPLTPTTQDQEFFFEINLSEPNLGEYTHIKYGYSFVWYRDDRSGARITDEWLDARCSESVRYTSYIKRAKQQYRKCKNTQSFKSISLDSNQLAIDILPLIQDIEIGQVAACLHSMDYRICSSLDLRSKFQPIPFEYITDQAGQAVAFDDDDIPRALYSLKINYPDKYNLFEDAVFTLFPEFSKIIVSAVDASAVAQQEIHSIQMVIKDGKLAQSEIDHLQPPVKLKEELYRLIIVSKHLNQPLSIANMSAGTKRVIWLLANIFIAACANINVIGIEEIETSIHPKLLKSLLEILSDTAGDTCIILSSHSPYLIQYLKATNLYIGVPNDNGVANFRRIKKSKAKQLISISRDQDMSIGEFVFDTLTKERYSSMLEQYLEDGIDEE